MPIKTASKPSTMTESEWIHAIKKPRKSNNLLGSNRKLKKDGIHQWSLPALTASVWRNNKLITLKTCPMAGACGDACYACQGAFMWNRSMASHTRNLQWFIDDSKGLANDLIVDIKRKRSLTAVRIHDSGDFFNRTYALWWIGIMKALPEVQFYAYTKQVSMFKRLEAQGKLPSNFTLVYSFGGKEDALIDEDNDRHSKVFASHDDMVNSGYYDTTVSDLYASMSNIKRIGLVYHGVKSVKNVMGNKRVL